MNKAIRASVLVRRRWCGLILLAALGALVAPSAASADAVTDWNTTMIDAQTAAAVGGPPGDPAGGDRRGVGVRRGERVRPRFTSVHVPPAAPRFASRDAAAVAAAHEALVALMPDQAPLLDARYAASLATLHGSERSIDAGLAWGTHVADEIAGLARQRRARPRAPAVRDRHRPGRLAADAARVRADAGVPQLRE